MKYRKKPVVIDAIQYNGNNKQEIEQFVGQKLETKGNFLMIPTLESPHEATITDYIIKGVIGEFYPCKEHVFLATYEKVKE